MTQSIFSGVLRILRIAGSGTPGSDCSDHIISKLSQPPTRRRLIESTVECTSCLGTLSCTFEP